MKFLRSLRPRKQNPEDAALIDRDEKITPTQQLIAQLHEDIDGIEDFKNPVNQTTITNSLAKFWSASKAHLDKIKSDKRLDPSQQFTTLFFEFHQIWREIDVLVHRIIPAVVLMFSHVFGISDPFYKSLKKSQIRLVAEYWKAFCKTFLKDKNDGLDRLEPIIINKENDFFLRRCAVEYLYTHIATEGFKDQQIRNRCDELAKSFSLEQLAHLLDSSELQLKIEGCKHMVQLLEKKHCLFELKPYAPNTSQHHTWVASEAEINALLEKYTQALMQIPAKDRTDSGKRFLVKKFFNAYIDAPAAEAANVFQSYVTSLLTFEGSNIDLTFYGLEYMQNFILHHRNPAIAKPEMLEAFITDFYNRLLQLFSEIVQKNAYPPYVVKFQNLLQREKDSRNKMIEFEKIAFQTMVSELPEAWKVYVLEKVNPEQQAVPATSSPSYQQAQLPIDEKMPSYGTFVTAPRSVVGGPLRSSQVPRGKPAKTTVSTPLLLTEYKI